MSIAFWKFVEEHLSQGESVFLAHVAHHTRHSPGTSGAQLAVRKDGSTVGTIGGGVMEAQVLQKARQAFESRDFSPQKERLYHRRNAPKDGGGRPSGLGCAGNQTNIYHMVTPKDLGVVRDIAARHADDRPGQILISASGLSITDGRPEQIEAPIRFKSEEPWRLSMEILNWKRIAIIGGGHCGLALSRQMHLLGYAVTVIDNRRDVFTFSNNEFADQTVAVDDYQDAAALITYPSWTHVVVMTANVDADIRALSQLAGGPYPYLGVMGAPAKLQRIRRELADQGISERALDQFYAPIGLDMTSNTPAEIAVSIAAEILRERQRLFPFTAPAAI